MQNHTVFVVPLLPYFANVSIILLTCTESLLASLAILTHSLMFELLSLLYTPSAIRRAISLSTPSSLSNTFTTISTNSSSVYGLKLISLNLVSNGGNSLSVLLHEANTHVLSWVVLCWLCFSSDNIPDSITLRRLVWSFLFIFSSSSIIK